MNTMNAPFVKKALVPLMLALALGSLPQAMAATEEEKLKALEAEVNGGANPQGAAPQDAAPTRRTRAIVFDTPKADAKPEAKPETSRTAAKSEGKSDCQAKVVNNQAKPIDFAVQFKLGSAEVQEESQALLKKIADILAQSPDRCVVIEGHTDITGAASANLALSKQRAKSVANFIAGQGKLKPSHLVPVGLGATELLKDLDASDPKHRRVVFKVVS